MSIDRETEIAELEARLSALKSGVDSSEIDFSNAEADRIRQQTDRIEFSHRAKPEFARICRQIGIDDVDGLLKSLGGLHGGAFEMSDLGRLQMYASGKLLPIAEALAIHPAAAPFRAMAERHVRQDDRMWRQKCEIKQYETEIERLKKTANRRTGQIHADEVAVISKLRQKIKKLQAEIDTVENPVRPRPVDFAKQSQVDDLDRQLSALKSRIGNRPPNDKELSEVGILSRKKQALLREMHGLLT